jgi:hypothetical protein
MALAHKILIAAFCEAVAPAAIKTSVSALPGQVSRERTVSTLPVKAWNAAMSLRRNSFVLRLRHPTRRRDSSSSASSEASPVQSCSDWTSACAP